MSTFCATSTEPESEPGVACAGETSQEQNTLLTKLRGVLGSSNFMEEMHRCKVMVIPESIKPDKHCYVWIKRIRVEKCRESYQLVRREIENFTDREKKAYLELGLQEILSHYAVEKFLQSLSKSKTNPATLEKYYQQLRSVYDGNLSAPNTATVRRIPQNATRTEFNKVCLSRCRETAVRTFLTCLLALGLVYLGAISLAPDSVQTIYDFQLRDSSLTRTFLAFLILMLTVCLFQLITRLARPGGGQRLAYYKGVETKLFSMSLTDVSILRIVAGCCGPIMLGLGTGVSASAGFGAFGVTVMLDGIYQTLGIPYWLSQFSLTFLCYVGAWRWAQIPLGLGTIPALFLIGPAISFSAAMAPDDLGFFGNLIAFGAGTLVFAFGIATSAAAALGPDGKTVLTLAAEKSSHWPIPHSSFFFNLSAILIGITLAGNFGVATLLNLFIVPVLLNYLIPPMRRILSDD